MSDLWSKMYNEGELLRIEALQEKNKSREDLYGKERKEWNNRLSPLFTAIYQNNFTTNNSKNIINAQAESYSYRQMLNEQISIYAQDLTKVKSDNRVLAQRKFLFYSTGFGMKVNLGEKKLLIEGNLSENSRASDLLETQIEFLRDTLKTLESYQFSIKNIISLLDYLGK